MQTTTRLGLTKWNLGSDPYNHLELAANWQVIDDKLLKRDGDTATGTMIFSVSTTTTQAIGVKANADAASRIKVQPDSINFGDGSGSYDVKLYRTAADKLKLDDQLEVNYSGGASILSSNGASLALQAYKTTAQAFIENRLLSTDTQPSLQILGSGELKLGVGGSTATDVRIYRSAASEVTIANDLKVANITASNSLVISGVTLSIAAGAFQTSAAFTTTNIIRARDGVAGRIQLGNSSDNTISAIYFGGSADVNLYRFSSGGLKTDGGFITGGIISVLSNGTNSITTAGGIIATGTVTTSANLQVTGVSLLTGNIQGGAAISANGLTPITGTVLGSNLRVSSGGKVTLPSGTNSNMWVERNTIGDLEWFTEVYNSSGSGAVLNAPGSSDPIRMTLKAGGDLILPNGQSFWVQQDSAHKFRFHHLNGNSYIDYGPGFFQFRTLGGGILFQMQQDGATTFTGPTTNLQSLYSSYINVASSGGGTPNKAVEVLHGDLLLYDGLGFAQGGWQSPSDSNLKTKPKSVNNILSKINEMESLGQWRFKKNAMENINHTEFHYGPSAQEFNSLFKNEIHTVNVANKDIHVISISDIAGIALLGVQALTKKIEALESIIKSQE